MNVKHDSISNIIRILKKETRRLKTPSVTEIALDFHDPFHVLISCILSLRTKDDVTLKASRRLFSLAREPRAMSKLPVLKIAKTIYPVGFYRTKAKNIKQICIDLLKHFKGKVPDDLDVLLSLKGVGRKTANLVLTEGFDKPGVCVDTHVHRISNRLGFVKTKTPFDTEMALRKKLPKRYWKDYNYLLVTWGQNICAPIGPKCSMCKIFSYCKRAGVSKHR
ncbi:endonuclease III domain-containing protein [Candidatus Omnitrophota bacterium]